ncbi:MAG: sigma-54-dependent Fis family transcriptional regulator [Deltaproteobacteria bacterium]|nr:sigma-54-dependent Fis family transcriptional regulator [Deltaproteobacteria bacterium]
MREVLAYQVGEVAAGELDVVATGEEGLAAFDPRRHAVVVTDLKMPGLDGLAVMRRVLEKAPETLVVVVTAFGDVAVAVEAMKAGAFDFVPKPFDRDHLHQVIRKALSVASLKNRVEELERTLDWGERALVFVSPAMGEAVRLADRVAASDATVLLTGESGTGKELLARRVHARSPRRKGPFVAVNCGAIPRELLESELFGHVRGAFTGAVRDHKGRFEVATGGTLFLDEVGELPKDLQPKLLRALETGQVDPVGGQPRAVDVRIVAATNRDLAAEAADDRFRADLFFRLAVVEVRVPALRERPEDVPVLVEHFLAKWGGGRRLKVAPDALRALQAAPWPGNVRELENACRRFCLLAEDGAVPLGMAQAVAHRIAPSRKPSEGLVLPPDGLSLRGLEKEVILRAFRLNGMNQSRTARYLRIPRHILLYRMKKYGIGTEGTEPGDEGEAQ